jgi:hypothetical protein
MEYTTGFTNVKQGLGAGSHICPLFHFGNSRLPDAQGFGKHFPGGIAVLKTLLIAICSLLPALRPAPVPGIV